MHVLGTAGHVDHGKSALVRALTGTDPDRWIEERLRGMTLDLGFAHLRFEGGIEAGIVDVPGHERFLHNMLAGAAGMELLLLVVAMNEGVGPQTLEHLAILDYLNVRRTLVVATKIDLVPENERSEAAARIRAGLRETTAAQAPLFPVSSVTGEGLDALRDSIRDALRALPPRAPDAPAYLPLDRAFVVPGAGTVVTGTLMQGRIAIGDTLQLVPLGRELRVRGLQVFGRPHERVAGGARVAVNLVGIETSAIARGAVLASAEFVPTRSFAVRFGAREAALASLRRRTPVRAYVGSAEILGTLQFETVPAGVQSVPAILHLRAPTIAPPGSAFVVRRLSPKELLGGGTIAGPYDAGAGGAASEPAETFEDDRVAAALRAAGLEGATPTGAGATANVRADVAQVALDDAVAAGRAYRLARPAAFVDAGVADALLVRVLDALSAHQIASPWSMGATSLALARTLAVVEPALVRLLALFAGEGRLAHRAGYFATLNFVPALRAEQRTFFERELAPDPGSPLTPTSLEKLVAAAGASRIAGLSQALDMLFAGGTLVKVGVDVYCAAQIDELRARLERGARNGTPLTVAAFRDLVGTSRKYAVPLLEWFDATGVTVRAGDLRRLRGHDASGAG
ncbi:MAG: selenocysteine-specific translation elongation factor [Candidatus Baltobacteraceae bacterium]